MDMLNKQDNGTDAKAGGVVYYDGTWPGFLLLLGEMAQGMVPWDCTIIAEGYGQPANGIPGNVIDSNGIHQTGLGNIRNKAIKTGARALADRLGRRRMGMVRLCHASRLPNIERMIIDFYRSVGENRGDGHLLLELEKTARRVGLETHRYLGILRFHMLEKGVLYGPMEPDFPVAGLVAAKMDRRRIGARWVIHDVKRNQAVWRFDAFRGSGSGDECAAALGINFHTALTGRELEIREQWQAYFDHASIESRSNKKQQDGYLPARYRSYLPEFFDKPS